MPGRTRKTHRFEALNLTSEVREGMATLGGRHEEGCAQGVVRQLQQCEKKVRLRAPVRAMRAVRRRGVLRVFGAKIVHNVLDPESQVRQGAAVCALHSGWERLLVFERRRHDDGAEKTPAPEHAGDPRFPRGGNGRQC